MKEVVRMMVQVSGDRRTARRWLIACALFAALILALIVTTASSPSGVAQAQSSTTVSFQNGVSPSASYAGTIDTHLSQANTTTNYGGATTLLIDGDDPNASNN